MGLLYQMPVSEQEADRVEINDQTLLVKSYGLPLIFWGYLLAILSVVAIMVVAIKDPISKVIAGEDAINRLLGYGVSATLIIIPLFLLAFFFYEKVISKSDIHLKVTHKVFWIPFKSTRINLRSKDSFTLEHFLDSPNMARIQKIDEMRAFENRGYFELFAITSDDQLIQIDRSSQKKELVKLKDFLAKY